jgi:hypothetical protein
MKMALNVFEKGDWIQGRSREGELIHGYVESIDSIQGIIKVFVIESDNEKVIGKAIWILIKYAEKLPIMKANNENELLSLIDIALLTKDKQWFIELSERLSSIKKISTNKGKKSNFSISGNRFENIDTKQ